MTHDKPLTRAGGLGRCFLAAVLAIGVIAALSVSDAQAARLLPLPKVTAETYATDFHGRPVVVLQTLVVRRIHGKPKVTCNKCLRFAAHKPVTTRLSRTSRRYRHADWILRGGRAVKVKVTRKGWIGRYLLLTARRRNGRLGLGYKATGCLSRTGAKIRCPQGAPKVPPITVLIVPVPVPPPASPPTAPPPPPVKPPPAPPVKPPPAPQPATFTEQEELTHPANTFKNYHNASGEGPPIAAGQKLQVSCKVHDATILSANPDGYWYRIASSPWNNAYYTPANNFVNGGRNTDPAVKNC